MAMPGEPPQSVYTYPRKTYICNCVLGPGPNGCNACGAPPQIDWTDLYPRRFLEPPTITTTGTSTVQWVKQKPAGEAMRAEDV